MKNTILGVPSTAQPNGTPESGDGNPKGGNFLGNELDRFNGGERRRPAFRLI